MAQDRHRARDLSGAHPARRRHRVRGATGARAARRSDAAACPNSARSRPTSLLAPSRAACMRREHCRSPVRCRAGATTSASRLGREPLGRNTASGSQNGVAPVIISAISRPVTGAERQPPMRVTVVEPQPRLSRRAADHRTRVGEARPRSHPGLRLDAARPADRAPAPPASAGRTAPASARRRGRRIRRRS